MRALLQAEQQVARSSPRDSYDEHIAGRNITDLETLRTRSEENDRIRQQGAAERAAAADAKRAERQAAGDAALKAELRAQFMGQAGATEEDFARLFSILRDQYLVKQAGETLARARNRLGRI